MVSAFFREFAKEGYEINVGPIYPIFDGSCFDGGWY